jgi:hypothetical protein
MYEDYFVTICAPQNARGPMEQEETIGVFNEPHRPIIMRSADAYIMAFLGALTILTVGWVGLIGWAVVHFFF